MKKLLLASVAVSGLAFAPTVAHAEVNLEIGGYFKGYGVVQSSDEEIGTGTTADAKTFDFIRDTEIHIGGETTLDNGLTVGAHFEFDADGADGVSTDESYLYFSGDWGRVNFGEEDGAAYLLQVAAPSADSNLDGIRQYVSPFQVGNFDYASDNAKDADKLTYLSPIFSGFQVGVSYAAETDANAASFGSSTEDLANEETYEVAARYEGQFQNVGVIAGAGYTHTDNATTGGEDPDSINVGLDLDIAAFGIGVAYLDETSATDVDSDVLVVGADYTTGPFKIGVNYATIDVDGGLEADRYTAGVNYNYGPGMSFRGSIQHLDSDSLDADGTALVLGTQVNF